MIIDDVTLDDLDAIVAFEAAFAPKERWSRASWEEELRNPSRVILVARGFETLTSFAPQPSGHARAAVTPRRVVPEEGAERPSRRVVPEEGAERPSRRVVPEEGAERPSRRVVGVLVLAPGPDVTDLMRIVVAPDHARQGIADHLLTAGFERCPGRWLLEVREDNTPATRLYEKHNFTTIDRRADYYGAGVDALILERRDDE